MVICTPHKWLVLRTLWHCRGENGRINWSMQTGSTLTSSHHSHTGTYTHTDTFSLLSIHFNFSLCLVFMLYHLLQSQMTREESIFFIFFAARASLTAYFECRDVLSLGRNNLERPSLMTEKRRKKWWSKSFSHFFLSLSLSLSSFLSSSHNEACHRHFFPLLMILNLFSTVAVDLGVIRKQFTIIHHFPTANTTHFASS